MATVPIQIDEHEAKRQRWLEERKTGIGGSDAAAVLGLHPWKSALALYCEKTEIIETEDKEETEAMEWGKILEPVVAKKYERETGRNVISYGEFKIWRNKRYPFILSTLDRGVKPVPEYEGPGVLEIKTTGFFKQADWDGDVPAFPAIQLQHELLTTDRKWGSLAVLIGGQRFKWIDIPRNENFCSYLLEKEEEFWDRVKRGDPPAPDGSDSSCEAVKRLCVEYHEDEVVALPDEAVQWDTQLIDVKANLSDLERQKKELENQIKLAIGAANFGVLPGGGRYSFKEIVKASYVCPESRYRTLRRLSK